MTIAPSIQDNTRPIIYVDDHMETITHLVMEFVLGEDNLVEKDMFQLNRHIGLYRFWGLLKHNCAEIGSLKPITITIENVFVKNYIENIVTYKREMTGHIIKLKYVNCVDVNIGEII